MSDEKNCPKCTSENIYFDGSLWICPECAFEWAQGQAAASAGDDAPVADDGVVRDANGNTLADGDSVVVLKDLKIKGASSVVKGGTKVRNIRLVPPVDGHDIACKIDGIGAIHLKSEYVKKA